MRTSGFVKRSIDTGKVAGVKVSPEPR